MPLWTVKAFAELTAVDIYALLKLRQDIFCLEQNCLYADIDDLDQSAHHVMLWHKDELLAYSRCLPPTTSDKNSSSIGRVAVIPKARGQQTGRLLMEQSIAFNLEHYPAKNICISAQLHLQLFYSSLGFVSQGESYSEDGIDHMKMLLPATSA